MAAIWSSSQFSNIMSIYNCFSTFKCQFSTGLLKLSSAQFQPSSYYYFFFFEHFFFITSNSRNFNSYINQQHMDQGWWVWTSFPESRSRSKSRSKSIFCDFSLMLRDFFSEFCMWIECSMLISQAEVALKLFFTVFEIWAAQVVTPGANFQIVFSNIWPCSMMHLDERIPNLCSEWESEVILTFKMAAKGSKIVNFQNVIFVIKNESNGS